MFLQLRCHPDEFLCEKTKECIPRALPKRFRYKLKACSNKKVCKWKISVFSNYYCKKEKVCILMTSKYSLKKHLSYLSV